MKLDVLLSGLASPEPAVRLDVVRVLGMLDEVRALPALRKRYAAEPEPQVQQAIKWAGKRLFRAEQAGYSTIDEVFRHFRIDQEIETIPDATEQAVVRQLQDRLDSDMRDFQERSARRKAGTAFVASMGGAAAGISAMAMAMDMLQASNNNPGSNLGTPDLTVKRTPATAPTNADIDVWLKRLRGATDPEVRKQAVLELKLLNNPRALPFLALAFLTDESPQVRQAAQQHGKILYWSAVYWEMEQSGELAREMQRRAEALGKELELDRHMPGAKPAGGTGDTGPLRESSAREAKEPSQSDVSEILRKAEEGRRKRKSKPR